MARNELENLIRFAKMNDMMNWALEEVLNEYETTKMHHKEPKFDLKTLKPFDKVLVRDYSTNKWGADFFLAPREEHDYVYCILNSAWKYCIPYNEETKYLLGTKEDCPEYYKWWEEQL